MAQYSRLNYNNMTECEMAECSPPTKPTKDNNEKTLIAEFMPAFEEIIEDAQSANIHSQTVFNYSKSCADIAIRFANEQCLKVNELLLQEFEKITIELKKQKEINEELTKLNKAKQQLDEFQKAHQSPYENPWKKNKIEIDIDYIDGAMHKAVYKPDNYIQKRILETDKFASAKSLHQKAVEDYLSTKSQSEPTQDQPNPLGSQPAKNPSHNAWEHLMSKIR